MSAGTADSGLRLDILDEVTQNCGCIPIVFQLDSSSIIPAQVISEDDIVNGCVLGPHGSELPKKPKPPTHSMEIQQAIC